jgi:copper chaperone CopZ
VAVEKAIRRLDGVADAQVNFDQKLAHVHLKPGAPFEPDKFREVIEKAGEKVRDYELTVAGTLERQEKNYYLRPTGVMQRFAVRSASPTVKPDGLVGKTVHARGKLVFLSGSGRLQPADGPPTGGRYELQLTELRP